MSKFAIHFILGITALSLAGGALATAVSNKAEPRSRGESDKCALHIENKTDAPATVGVSGGSPSVTVSAAAKNLIMVDCEILDKTSQNSNYNRLVRKQDKNTYVMTLTAKKEAATKAAAGTSKNPFGSKGPGKPATATPSGKAETFKLDSGLAKYIWITSTQPICPVPGC